MKVWIRRLLAPLRLPAGIAGALLGLTLFQLSPGGHRLAGLLVGWLYGIALWGLMRLLPVRRGWAWLAGLLVGPVPVALLLPDGTPSGERGVLLLGALFGLLLGLLETAAQVREPRRQGVPGAPGSGPEAGEVGG